MADLPHPNSLPGPSLRDEIRRSIHPVTAVRPPGRRALLFAAVSAALLAIVAIVWGRAVRPIPPELSIALFMAWLQFGECVVNGGLYDRRIEHVVMELGKDFVVRRRHRQSKRVIADSVSPAIVRGAHVKKALSISMGSAADGHRRAAFRAAPESAEQVARLDRQRGAPTGVAGVDPQVGTAHAPESIVRSVPFGIADDAKVWNICSNPFTL